MRSLNPWPIFPSHLEPPIARSLSIQFILQELIHCFELLAHLRKFTQTQLTGTHLKTELAAIFKQLGKFLLFSLENPFAQKGSGVDNLYFYCEILLQASHIAETDLLTILEQMKNAILNVKLKMILWKKEAVPVSEIASMFLELYSSLHQNLFDFFQALYPFLKEARPDENVLAYLIERKDRLNFFLGEGRIERLLQTLFPEGHDQLRAAIHEGYTRRGFASVFSQIEPLINAIEWETPCHSPATL